MRQTSTAAQTIRATSNVCEFKGEELEFRCDKPALVHVEILRTNFAWGFDRYLCREHALGYSDSGMYRVDVVRNRGRDGGWGTLEFSRHGF